MKSISPAQFILYTSLGIAVIAGISGMLLLFEAKFMESNELVCVNRSKHARRTSLFTHPKCTIDLKSKCVAINLNTSTGNEFISFVENEFA